MKHSLLLNLGMPHSSAYQKSGDLKPFLRCDSSGHLKHVCVPCSLIPFHRSQGLSNTSRNNVGQVYQDIACDWEMHQASGRRDGGQHHNTAEQIMVISGGACRERAEALDLRFQKQGRVIFPSLWVCQVKGEAVRQQQVDQGVHGCLLGRGEQVGDHRSQWALHHAHQPRQDLLRIRTGTAGLAAQPS